MAEAVERRAASAISAFWIIWRNTLYVKKKMLKFCSMELRTIL